MITILLTISSVLGWGFYIQGRRRERGLMHELADAHSTLYSNQETIRSMGEESRRYRDNMLREVARVVDQRATIERLETQLRNR